MMTMPAPTITRLAHPWREVRWYAELDSTQLEAGRLMDAGEDLRGVAICAETQTGGLGRQGRGWNSGPGGLYVTAVLPRKWTIDERWLGWVPLLGALACVRQLDEQFHLAAQIKWPNDVVLSGGKLAGLLGESRLGPGSGRSLMLGMGLNWANQVDPEAVEGRLRPISVAEAKPGVTAEGRMEFLPDWLAGLARRVDNLIECPECVVKRLRENVGAQLWRRGEIVELEHTEHGAVRGELLGVGTEATATLKLEDGTILEAGCGRQADYPNP